MYVAKQATECGGNKQKATSDRNHWRVCPPVCHVSRSVGTAVFVSLPCVRFFARMRRVHRLQNGTVYIMERAERLAPPPEFAVMGDGGKEQQKLDSNGAETARQPAKGTHSRARANSIATASNTAADSYNSPRQLHTIMS